MDRIMKQLANVLIALLLALSQAPSSKDLNFFCTMWGKCYIFDLPDLECIDPCKASVYNMWVGTWYMHTCIETCKWLQGDHKFKIDPHCPDVWQSQRDNIIIIDSWACPQLVQTYWVCVTSQFLNVQAFQRWVSARWRIIVSQLEVVPPAGRHNLTMYPQL